MKRKIIHITLFLRRLQVILLLFGFATLFTDGQSVRFALLADIHLSPGTPSEANLTSLVEDINSTNAEFVIVAGDITNTGSDGEFLAVKNILDKLKKPLYMLPGNHETNWSESGGLTFNRLWGDDRFFFSHNGFSFAGFSTGPFMKMGDGFVKQEDLLWLKRQLIRRVPQGNILISVSHYPLAEGLSNWPEVTDLLNSSGCRLAFCGHGHRLSLMNFNGIPGIMCRAMVLASSSLPGYNIIEINSDSVYVYNKIAGKQEEIPALNLKYRDKASLSGIEVSALPDFSVNKENPLRYIAGEWDDTASILSGPCIVNDTLLIYGNSAGSLKAVGMRSGRIRWHIPTGGPVYSTPVSSDKLVMLGTVGGEILGLNASDGRLIWRVKTGRPVMAEGLFEDGSLFIGGGDKAFYRIDAGTGRVIWHFDGVNGLIQGKPVISGSSVMFGAWDTYFYCLDRNTGILRWKWNNGKPQKLYSPGNIYPVCTGERVFIVAPDRYMTAIDIASGKEIWRTNRHQVRESMGMSSEGSLVYAKLMNDTLIAVSADGHQPITKWKVDAGFGYDHNPCPVTAAGKYIIIATRNGILIAIDREKEQIAWKYKTGNSIINKVVTGRDQTYWFTMANGKVMGIK